MQEGTGSARLCEFVAAKLTEGGSPLSGSNKRRGKGPIATSLSSTDDRGRPSIRSSTRRVYIRRGGETKSEWEASDRKALLPGLPPQGVHPPEIVIDSLLPDEALRLLFEIYFSKLEAQSFVWDWNRREWVPSEH